MCKMVEEPLVICLDCSSKVAFAEKSPDHRFSTGLVINDWQTLIQKQSTLRTIV